MVSQQRMIIEMLKGIDKKSDQHSERLAGIEEHLRTLNGKVARNIWEIDQNRSKIDSVNIKIAKWGGGIIVALFAIEVGLKFLL